MNANLSVSKKTLTVDPKTKTPSWQTPMCDYTQVEYSCGHLRYIVKAWCTSYPETQKRCPLNVVEMCVLPSLLFQGLRHGIDSMAENID